MGWLREAWQRWEGGTCRYPWCFRPYTYDHRCHLHQYCDTRGEVIGLPVTCELVYLHRGWHKCGQHSWQNIDN